LRKAKHSGVGARLREIRCDWNGDDGAQFFADSLGIPMGTWLNYESGITVPGEIILNLLVTTRVTSQWLLSEQGAKYDR
jgi:hypothetical protein